MKFSKKSSKVLKSPCSLSCGCGKTYASRAALYTHIKIKHDSVPPAGTSSKDIKIKRGRPRKSVVEYSVISEFSEDKLLQEIGFLGNTPDAEVKLEGKILEKFNFWQTQEMTDSQTCTCDDIFGQYLVYILSKVSTHGFNLFSFYTKRLRDCLNDKGWDFIQHTDTAGQEFCSLNSPSEIPNICNYFVQHFLGESERELGISFLLHFCNWIYENYFTTYKLNLIQYH